MPEVSAERAPAASAPQASPEERMAALFGRTESEPDVTQETAPEAAEPETESTEQAPERAEGEEPEASDGLIDFELDGKQYRVPPEFAGLKDSVSMKAEYTRKTQDLADLRRQSATIAETQRLQQEFQHATQKEQTELQAINSQIELYKKLDWTGMDSDTMIRRKHEMDMLREQATDLNKALTGKNQEFQRTTAVKRAELAKNAYDFVAKHVPGFKPDSDVEKSLAKYVDEAGLPVDAFVNGTLAYPSVAVMAFKAMKYDQLKAGSKDAIRKVQAGPVVKPGPVTNSAATKKYTEVRASLKKSGSLQDAAKLFMLRSK